MKERISEKIPYPSKYAEVYGSKMHYIEAGSGNPILFLHGVPASSYLWRNVIPHLTSLGRCIAPDLIGFGKSDKPDIEYSILDHIRYIERFVEVLGLNRITLIMHGFGSISGFHYAMKHEKNCNGLVFYEAFLQIPEDDQISIAFQEQMASLQTELPTDMTENGIAFVDKMLAQNVMRQLTAEEMENYRAPFKESGSVKPLITYLKELPYSPSKADDQDKTNEVTDKEKKELNQIIANYTSDLKKTNLPKLMLYSIPGFITTVDAVMWAKANLPNIEIADIGEEFHLGQESYPTLIGKTISVWLQGLEQMKVS